MSVSLTSFCLNYYYGYFPNLCQRCADVFLDCCRPFISLQLVSTVAIAGKLKSYTSSSGGGGGHGGTIEDEADYYEREIEKYMQESLDSTQRSRAHLENSEKIGANTMQVSVWVLYFSGPATGPSDDKAYLFIRIFILFHSKSQ